MKRLRLAHDVRASIQLFQPTLVLGVVARPMRQDQYILLRRILAQRLGASRQDLAHLRRLHETLCAHDERRTRIEPPKLHAVAAVTAMPFAMTGVSIGAGNRLRGGAGQDAEDLLGAFLETLAADEQAHDADVTSAACFELLDA